MICDHTLLDCDAVSTFCFLIVTTAMDESKIYLFCGFSHIWMQENDLEMSLLSNSNLDG